MFREPGFSCSNIEHFFSFNQNEHKARTPSCSRFSSNRVYYLVNISWLIRSFTNPVYTSNISFFFCSPLHQCIFWKAAHNVTICITSLTRHFSGTKRFEIQVKDSKLLKRQVARRFKFLTFVMPMVLPLCSCHFFGYLFH